MPARDKTLVQFGLRTRQLREAASLTQEALAEAANLDITYISGIERCPRKRGVNVLFSLANGLRV